MRTRSINEVELPGNRIRKSSGEIIQFGSHRKLKNWEKMAHAFKSGWRPTHEGVDEGLVSRLLGRKAEPTPAVKPEVKLPKDFMKRQAHIDKLLATMGVTPETEKAREAAAVKELGVKKAEKLDRDINVELAKLKAKRAAQLQPAQQTADIQHDYINLLVDDIIQGCDIQSIIDHLSEAQGEAQGDSDYFVRARKRREEWERKNPGKSWGEYLSQETSAMLKKGVPGVSPLLVSRQLATAR